MVPEDSRWRPVKDFPGYWISQYGQVWLMYRTRLVQPHLTSRGVVAVSLYRRQVHLGTSYSRSVAKLTREAWGPAARLPG